MVRRFEESSGLAARIREVPGGEWHLGVYASGGFCLLDRLFPREPDAESCLYRCYPAMREVA